MKIDLANLPDDVNLLRQMFIDLLDTFRRRERESTQEIEKLKQQIAQLRRGLYGRSSEKLDANQLRLAFESVHQQMFQAPEPPPLKERSNKEPKAPPKGHGRKKLPEDLPRETTQIEPDEEQKTCPDCNGTSFEKVGEDVTEQLEYRPASFVVKQFVRPKYACSTCHGSIVVGDLPQAVIEKGIPGPGLLAHVITSKYSDHLPLNRLEEIFARHGVDISRKTMCDWVAHVADLLEPIYATMVSEVMSSKVIHADDSPVKVLDRTVKGKTRQGRLWVYVGDDDHAHTVYDYQTTRKRDGPNRLLKYFTGYLQGDCWKGFTQICGPAGAKKASCMAHARRKFFDAQNTEMGLSLVALQFIRALYDVEDEATSLSSQQRYELRQQESVPILRQFEAWLRTIRTEVLPKSPLGQAISYTLSNWCDLKRYVDDGDVNIDNNKAERALRPIAVGRKNWICVSRRRSHDESMMLSA